MREERYRIERYKERFWALFDLDNLVCVTVYKKGGKGGFEEIRKER